VPSLVINVSVLEMRLFECGEDSSLASFSSSLPFFEPLLRGGGGEEEEEEEGDHQRSDEVKKARLDQPRRVLVTIPAHPLWFPRCDVRPCLHLVTGSGGPRRDISPGKARKLEHNAPT